MVDQLTSSVAQFSTANFRGNLLPRKDLCRCVCGGSTHPRAMGEHPYNWSRNLSFDVSSQGYRALTHSHCLFGYSSTYACLSISAHQSFPTSWMKPLFFINLWSVLHWRVFLGICLIGWSIRYFLLLLATIALSKAWQRKVIPPVAQNQITSPHQTDKLINEST